MQLYDYQQHAVDEVSASIAFGEHFNIAIDAPTSAGKSIIIAGLCRELNNNDIVIMVNITELIDQISEHLTAFNIEHSILKAGRDPHFKPDCRVQLVMAQTLHSRLAKIDLKCDYIIQDEFHKEYLTDRTNAIISKLNPDKRIGLSATPFDHLGFALKDCEIIQTKSVQHLQEDNKLCPIKYYIPKYFETIDYSKVKKTGNEYNAVDLDKIVASEKFLSKAIEAMNQMKAKDKKTIVFCSSIEQSVLFSDMLNRNGYESVAIHSKNNAKENERIIEAFKHDKNYVPKSSDEDTLFSGSDEFKGIPIRALVSVAKLTTGFSVKSIQLGVMLAKTNVRSKYIQSIGRLCRVHPSKEYAELLDCSSNVSTFGFHTADYAAPQKPINQDDINTELEKIEKKYSMPNLDLVLEGSEPQEIDLDKYHVIIKSLEAKEKAMTEKKQNISNWTIKELANTFAISRNHETIIRLGVEINRRKFGDPISKAGFSYKLKPETLWGTSTFGNNEYFHVHHTMEEYFEMYPHKQNQWIASLKTRLKNLIKNGEPLFKITGFIKFLAENYKESQKDVYAESKEVYSGSDYKPNTYAKPEPIHIDESEIPF